MATVNNIPELFNEYVSDEQIAARETTDCDAAVESGRPILAAFERFFLVGKQQWCVLHYGESRVEIWVQAEEFFCNMPAEEVPLSLTDPRPVTPAQWAKAQSTGMLGGRYRVKLLGVDDSGDRPRYLGSRLDAMADDRERVFFPHYANGNLVEDKLPKVGDMIYARVIDTRARKITVEAGGVEVEIPRSELAWLYPEDCRDRWSAGDVVKAVITSLDTKPTVEQDEDGHIRVDGEVNVSLSIKQLTKRNDAAERYNIGDRVHGKVISELPDGVIVGAAGEVTVFVHYNKDYTRPLVGQEVILEIASIETKPDGTKSLSGYIKSQSAYLEREKRRIV